MSAISLKCSECSHEYDLDKVVYTCMHCGGLLDVKYDYASLQKSVSREELESRRVFTMWKYEDFLPIKRSKATTLGESFTPIVKSGALKQLKTLKNLYFKLDFMFPTGSFKDRGASLMVSKAKELSMKITAIDSSGNAAASVAGYSAKAGLQCYVFTPSYASVSKLVQSMAYGATVFAVEGSRNDAYETAKEAYQRYRWYYCGFQTNPYAIEGLKTVAYEICEQLDWKAPDHVVIPVGTGSNLIGCWKGLKELYHLGWISHMPSLICVQAEGCAPIAKAYMNKLENVMNVEKPVTVAEGLMIAQPLKGKLALKALSETNGLAEIVSDKQILETSKLLAKNEGLLIEPSAAVSVAGLIKLVENKVISSDETIVCILTGSGLKTREIYAEAVGKPVMIKPGLDEVESILGKVKK